MLRIWLTKMRDVQLFEADCCSLRRAWHSKRACRPICNACMRRGRGQRLCMHTSCSQVPAARTQIYKHPVFMIMHACIVHSVAQRQAHHGRYRLPFLPDPPAPTHCRQHSWAVQRTMGHACSPRARPRLPPATSAAAAPPRHAVNDNHAQTAGARQLHACMQLACVSSEPACLYATGVRPLRCAG